MELVKREDHWALYNEDGHKIAATINGCNSKLSIKNCQSIANGYDLDELGREAYKKHNIDNLSLHEEIQRSGAFLVGHKEGFQKALEIIGDKRFSEEDMRKAMLNALEMTEYQVKQFRENNDYHIATDIIQSLQQTEWDVEIEWEKDTELFNVCPKLDVDGNLILKRIV